jgi:Bacterial capsule synthesis protein PGA_cap
MKRGMIFILLAAFLLVACAPVEVIQETATVVPPSPTSMAASFPPMPKLTSLLWVDPGLPEDFRKQVETLRVKPAETRAEAEMILDYTSDATTFDAEWVFVLAAPFPTVRDGVTENELEAILAGKAKGELADIRILLSPVSIAMLEGSGFEVSGDVVDVLPAEELLTAAWAEDNTWAVLPFEEVEPRWKVLAVEGVTPFSVDFDVAGYPLTAKISLTGETKAMARYAEMITLPPVNFDRGKMTTLLMTGVTALTRSTAARMDEEGVLYPGEDIREWMVSADLTHISNEVSFNPDCPPANFGKHIMHFCSRPEYIELLDDVGVDIIELSGNHLVDWGVPAFDYSLDLYEERDWIVFAGGENINAARSSAEVNHNGNQLVFIGCNPAGPEMVWATENHSGVADCDLDWMTNYVTKLSVNGYLPVVTFQYNESYGMVPGFEQERDFRRMSEAGAVVVSGSQAHHPQTMTFDQDILFSDVGFIHYGLGNLFFDQMRMPDDQNVPEVFDEELPVAGTRLEFLDQHIFYDNRYINTQLLTAVLEDYARPRPMTEEEREVFLTRMFEASEWELENE